MQGSLRSWGTAARQPHTLLLRCLDHGEGGVAIRDLPPRWRSLISQHRSNIRHGDWACKGMQHCRIALRPPVEAPPAAEIIKMYQRLQPIAAPHDRTCPIG